MVNLHNKTDLRALSNDELLDYIIGDKIVTKDTLNVLIEEWNRRIDAGQIVFKNPLDYGPGYLSEKDKNTIYIIIAIQEKEIKNEQD